MWQKSEDDDLCRGLDEESGWDLVTDTDQAKLRGCAVLGTFLLCVALFAGGLAFPLVEVVIFPGSPDMEEILVKSVMNMIGLAFENDQTLVGAIVMLCTVGIPMVLFIGMLVVMYENFFARGFGWNPMFRPGVRALVMSFMYISTSYQVVMVFLVMLFTCFFSGFGSETYLRCGFHFLAMYCLVSIGLVQAMEFLRVDLETQDPEDNELARIASVTGYNLRRSFSSFFPSLPGIKETTNIDTFQVFFFQLFFLVLLGMGFDQPLLDIRVMYKGVALQRMVLSMRDMMSSLSHSAPLPVMIIFAVLVIVIPVLYGFVLVVAGILDLALRFTALHEETLYQWTLWVAKVLRPWAMMDVFSIALIIVLYAVQNEYVSATIPDGIVAPSGLPSLTAANQAAGKLQAASSEHWLHFFGGMYLIVGAGIAAIFLRWFWSSSAGVYSRKGRQELDAKDLYQHVPMVSQSTSRNTNNSDAAASNDALLNGEVEFFTHEESLATRYVAGKSCRGLVLWTIVCLLLHNLPPPQQHFQLSSMNQAMQKSLPLLNSLMLQYAPETVGNCKYPATGIPQPCFEYGILDKEVMGETHRVTAEWMTGMKSLRLTNVAISRAETLAAGVRLLSDSMQATPTIMHRFAVTVSGVIENPRLFLKIEECPKNHTTLQAIIGQGLCKPFLDTADSCCEPHRTFDIQIAAECHLGDSSLGNLRVEGMRLDTMTVKPKMMRGQVEVLVADQNITKMVLASVKENIMYYLTEEPLLKFGSQSVNVLDFLNRVLRFNAPHEEFHCR